MDCYACQEEERFAALPPRENIVSDEHWRVVHAFDSALRGWLVLLPRRHVTSVAGLTDREAATLGTWQVRLSRALREETGCQKTYVMQFAEKDGFAHVHFHVVPRLADLPAEHRGPAVFHYARRPLSEQLSEVDRDEVALALRAALARRPVAADRPHPPGGRRMS
ncbi:HIT family protein [Cryptosporangium sp. NPDC051539]|uniref:HIT family protein n=1 Tax=Cryptosporangium sp. NPDC051539 TaxID=3363962 RepID=UPI00379FD5C1